MISACRRVTVCPAGPRSRIRSRPTRFWPTSRTCRPGSGVVTVTGSTDSMRRTGGVSAGNSTRVSKPVEHAHRIPCRVVEAWLAPPLLVEAGVVLLTLVQSGGGDRTRSGPPAGACDERVGGALGVLDTSGSFREEHPPKPVRNRSQPDCHPCRQGVRPALRHRDAVPGNMPLTSKNALPGGG